MVQLLLPKCNSHVVPEESSVPLTQVTDVGANRRKSTVRWIVRSANVQHVCRTYSAIFDSSSLVVGLLNVFGEVQRCAYTWHTPPLFHVTGCRTRACHYYPDCVSEPNFSREPAAGSISF